jgi:hypothetical protein
MITKRFVIAYATYTCTNVNLDEDENENIMCKHNKI